MMMSEICIEKAANGFIIECEYKPKPKAMKAGKMEMPEYHLSRKIEHVAVNEKDAIKKVRELIGKLESGMDDGDDE